jgi:signal peptidase I
MKKLFQQKSISKLDFMIVIVIMSIIFLMQGSMLILKTGLRVSTVSGQSMEKTLKDSSKLLLIGPDLKGIKRGDIVSILATDGNDERMNIMKRVIALPNEVIQIQGDKVYINYELLDEPYAYYDDLSDDFVTIALGEDEYFVMGDNRLHSLDSRHIGPVPREYILSVVIKSKESNK